MTASRTLLYGALLGLFIFIFVSGLSAHPLTDCGLPAVPGADSCADEITRWLFKYRVKE